MSTEDNAANLASEALDGRTKSARALKLQATQAGEAVPPSQRRKRASTGGFALKLDAPPRPGYVRRFVNGDPLRIARMEELGYSHVTEPAGEDSARTDGLGSRIARHAGKDEEGRPYRAFLMETPVEEFNVGVIDKEDARKPFEEAIRRSADPTGQVENAYQPGQSTIKHSAP